MTNFSECVRPYLQLLIRKKKNQYILLLKRSQQKYSVHSFLLYDITWVKQLTCRAVTCCRAFWHLVKQGSFIITMITGICLSIRASGPCFSSPARIPSECIYVISFIFLNNKKKSQKVTRWQIKAARSKISKLYICQLNTDIHYQVTVFKKPAKC